MIRRILCMHAFGTILCLTVANFAQAQCAAGGCATAAGCEVGAGGCATGHCGGGLLGRFRGGDCHDLGAALGPCYTCDNIWDGYCATKPRCLPQPHNPPHGNHFGAHRAGCGCNACCALGVGIYGKQCCPPRPHGHLLKNLFKQKPKCGTGCDSGCDKPGCDAGSCDAGCTAAPMKYVPASPARMQEEPADAGDDVPPAPALTEQAKNAKRGAFDWLQRALQLN